MWKERILAVVGSNGRLLIEMLPELEQVIGPQPEVSRLSVSENRFSHVFQQFVKLFCRFGLLLLETCVFIRTELSVVVSRPEHPLVLFLDDLQWADSTSLKLIPLIVSGDVRYLPSKNKNLFKLFGENVNKFWSQSPAINSCVQK